MRDILVTALGQLRLAQLTEAMVSTRRWSATDAKTDIDNILDEIHPVAVVKNGQLRATLVSLHRRAWGAGAHEPGSDTSGACLDCVALADFDRRS